MIRFAVIGTNWITHSFCQAAHETGKLQLAAVYSRSQEKAREFASQYQASAVYDDIEKMATSPDIEAVYIASPNSLHAPQAELFLKQGKHVIGEKPLASNINEVENLIATAQTNNVVLFEAMKTCYLPNFEVCRNALPSLGKLRRAHLTYCQYSSRYQKYLNGENPNTFNPEFSNGSVMDIGIYPLSFALALFGKPENLSATGSLLKSGVDAHGSMTLHYGEFEVLITHSKVSNGLALSEIQGEEGTLLIEHISNCEKVIFATEGKPPKELTQPQFENTMQYEASVFANLVQRNHVEHEGLARTRLVSQTLTQAREKMGVCFPADKHSIVLHT